MWLHKVPTHSRYEGGEGGKRVKPELGRLDEQRRLRLTNDFSPDRRIWNNLLLFATRHGQPLQRSGRGRHQGIVMVVLRLVGVDAIRCCALPLMLLPNRRRLATTPTAMPTPTVAPTKPGATGMSRSSSPPLVRTIAHGDGWEVGAGDVLSTSPPLITPFCNHVGRSLWHGHQQG